MHFYRSLTTIKAITFDLDDTLYDNTMIVERAEAELIALLQQQAALNGLTLDTFYQHKHAVSVCMPDIYHDVTAWRIETLRYLLQQSSFRADKINHIVDESMALFNTWRHKITVPSVTHQILTQLSQNYPLAVITNGNVDVNLVGLGDYFQFSLRGGANGRSKPFGDMFDLAAQQLRIEAKHILHVGDNLSADINGAVQSGMQSCWINIFDHDILQLSDARCLPHVEISKLSELYNLL